MSWQLVRLDNASGKLLELHVVPSRRTGEREHEASDPRNPDRKMCWCQPLLDFQRNGIKQWLHRRVQ